MHLRVQSNFAIMNLRIILVGIALITLRPEPALCGESEPAIAVKLDIPQIWQDAKVMYPRTLENRYPDHDQFSAVIENISAGPVLLSGSDRANLTFEVTDENGKMTEIHHVAEADSGKVPAGIRLEPGEASVRIIRYAAMKYGQPAEWEPFPFPHDPHRTETARKITLRAVYKQDSAGSRGYWTGAVVSKAYDVILEDNAIRHTDSSGEIVSDGIEMRLSVLMTNRETEFEVEFKNAGQKDVCLNLGEMVANGKIQVPSRVHIEFKDENGNIWKHFFPRSGVAGRVDDYLVPLRQGSTYTFTMPLDEFASADMKKQHEKVLSSGRYEISAMFEGVGAESVNLDMPGIRLMNFWKGRLQESIVTDIQ